MRLLSHLILHWAKSTFGESALSPTERALRLLEEAVELAQAEGVEVAQAQQVLARTYSRPPGLPAQEAGGCFVTLLAYCATKGIDPDLALEIETMRVLAKPAKVWKDKHDEKIKDGTAISSDDWWGEKDVDVS